MFKKIIFIVALEVRNDEEQSSLSYSLIIVSKPFPEYLTSLYSIHNCYYKTVVHPWASKSIVFTKFNCNSIVFLIRSTIQPDFKINWAWIEVYTTIMELNPILFYFHVYIHYLFLV